jgi:ABC-type nickel/cobalt efflux system permease component RcnA
MSFAFAQLTKIRKVALAMFLLLSGVLAIAPRNALAHPMGNFSVSHFAGIRIEPSSFELRYILDMAEIPTFQEMQATGITPNPDSPEVLAYLQRKSEGLKGGITVTLNGQFLTLETISTDVIFPPGAGNLPTMKIGVVYQASFVGTTCPCTLEYRDANFPERAGWKEVVATAEPGATLVMSSAPAVSRSQELASYPSDLINSPPQDLSARLTFDVAKGLALQGEGSARQGSSRGGAENPESNASAGTRALRPMALSSEGLKKSSPAGRPSAASAIGSNKTSKPFSGRMDLAIGASNPASETALTEKLTLHANKQGTPHNSFTDLIASKRWGFWFMITAALIAAALGGLHALEPGHGKTIVAAYLVGSQGTAAHALILGLIVTLTHTAGVYALGLITLYASKYIVPDHIYPWLGIASGLTIAFLGLYMLRCRLAGHAHSHGHHHHHGPFGHSHGHSHSHGHEHPHVHAAAGHSHPHSHDHSHDHTHDAGHSHHVEKQFSYRQLVTLGITGGIVPCPAALVVLLSAISLHRIAFGLYLIVAFSVGLAAVLISIGMVTVYARKLLSRVPSDGPLINRWLPTASAAVITCLGVGIATQALLSMGVLHMKF